MAEVGGIANLTGASNDMYSRKEHLFKKNNRYAKSVKKHVLVAGVKNKRQIIIIIILIIIRYIYAEK